MAPATPAPLLEIDDLHVAVEGSEILRGVSLAVPAGEHEIVFRHPQLWERRETTIIISGVPTRISATFNR